MSLGYALLHPRQLDAALVVKSEKRTFDTVFDLACGALGIDNVDEELETAFVGQAEAVAEFVARFETLFEPGRPLAHFKLIADFDFSNPDSMARAVETLCTFLETADSDQVKALAIPVIDAVLDILPNLETEAVAGFVTQRLDEIVGILKTPMRRGRKDVAAVKAYRATMSLKCLLDPAYQKLEALGRVDLKLILRETLIGLLDGLDKVDFTPLRNAVGGFKGEFGGLLGAILSCAQGASISAGAQTMSDEPLTFADEDKAAPHTLNNEGAIWVTDLVTNILNLFNLIWEIVRTRPFDDRGADGAFLIIGVVWHTVRTVVRAAFPDAINRPIGDEANAGQIFVNWLFTDWGDTAIHLFLRLLVTFFYEAEDAPTNWALMLAARWLTYFANTFNFRIWYQFARSLWYFSEHKTLQEVLDGSEITEDIDIHKMPLGRMLMGILPPIWAVMGIIGGALMPWENFEVENWGWEYGVMAGIPLVLWFISHFWVSAAAGTGVYGSIEKAALPDVPLFSTSVAGIIIMAVALGIVVGGLESDAQGLALTFLILIPVLLIGLLLTMGGFWIWGNTSMTDRSKVQEGFTQGFSALTTTVMGLLGAVIWWFTIDDGRDKEEVYDDLDVERTPYRLPMRAGENWFCGQSFHGVFSHLFSSATSHYAVDMNEAPGRAGTAARDGIVIAVTQGNPDDQSVQNDVNLLHSAWADNADPGTADERVLTYSNFVHTQERGVHARLGQFVPRGQHLTDIDSTGRSAQHHTHYSGQTAQRGEGREGLPFIFGDSSLRDFRNYPLLAFVPGKGQIQGKPLSFAFYVSENAEADPHPHAVTLDTGSAAVTIAGTPVPHSHRIIIDSSLFTGGTIPDPLTLRTTVAAGHFHTVTLSRAQLLNVFRMDAPESVSTSSDFGHSHTVGTPLIYEWIQFRTTDVEAAVNGTDTEHSHAINLGLDFLARNTIPAAGLTRTLSGSARHDHTVTLTAAQVALGFAFQDPAATTSGVATTTAGFTVGPHTHGTIRATGISAGARNMNARIAEPPAGQLTARNRGPYSVLGERMVVRINDRATEWHFWGAERVRAVADIAMDYGFGPGDQLRIGLGGTTVAAPAAPAPRLSLADTVQTLSADLRGPAPPPPLAPPMRRVALRTDPVVVVETRQRGSGARLELTGGTLPNAQLPAGAAAVATGTGPFADLQSVPRADFLAHVTNLVQNGWATPPGAVATSLTGGLQLNVTVGGAAAVFGGSSSRIEQVATTLYDTPSTEFRASGPIPAGSGRLALAAGFDVPLLATPARIVIPDPGANNTVNVTVNASAVPVDVPTGSTAAETARRIMQRTEGVRSWADGANLIVETVGAGPTASLALTVNGAGTFGATGARPSNFAFDDLTRLTPAHLEAIIDDAVARDPLPAVAGARNLRVTPDGNRLRVEVDAPATISAAISVTGTNDPVGFAAPQTSPQAVVSQDLAGNLRFDGPAWIDLTINDGGTDIVRIPIDGEPARLDIAPERLPDNGETLTFDVNGAPVAVNFDGTERSMAEVADKIGDASDALVVRLAHRVTVEEMLWGDQGLDLRLEDTGAVADGLALAGFLGPRPIAVNAGMARGEDMLAQGAVFPAPESRPGTLVDVMAFARVPSGGGTIMRMTVSGQATTALVNVTPGPDPLGFAAAATPDILESAPLPATVDLGGTVKEYHFRAQAPTAAGGLVDIAHGFTQLIALPAVARTTDQASLPIAGPAVLEIGITPPGGARRLVQTDLTGATSLDDVARRINAVSPRLRAWVARVSEVHNAESTRATDGGGDARTFDDRLHVETADGGTGWRLDFGDLQTAAALGFPMTAESGGVLLFSGRGNIQDGRAATRDEIGDALQEAADSMTGSDNPAGAQDRITVQTDGDTLELRSVEGQLDLVFEPADLANRIVTDVQPDVTQLNAAPGGGGAAPATLALDSGRILIRAAGRGLAAVELFAAPAELESAVPIPAADAAAVTEQLDLLKAHQLRVRINGTLRILPLVPASVTTLEDAVEFLARTTDPGAGWQGDDWWIGLLDVTGTPGAKRCVMQTVRRGSSAELELDLSTFPSPLPTNGILGFTQVVTTEAGVGNVPDMDAVPVAAAANSLLTLVQEAVERGGARQAIYAASADGTDVRLRGSLSTTTLIQATPAANAPGGINLSDPAGGGAAPTIEDGYAGNRALEPGFLEVRSDDNAVGNPRLVRSLFHAEPARLGPFAQPNALSALDGKTLGLSVNAANIDLSIEADGTTTPQSLARQLERKSNWSIRVILDLGGGAFTIESLRRGSAAALALRSPAGTNAVTGDPATGLTAPVDTDVDGSGSVGDIAAVTGADFAAVLQNGMIADRRQADASVLNGFLQIAGCAYDPPERDLTNPDLPVHALPREYARISSQRTGCASSVVPLTLRGAPALPAVFDMDRTLERAPAVRAAIRIPPIGNQDLSGRLHIQLNENNGIADLPPEQTVVIDVAAANYTAETLAALIHGRLFDAGIGAAQAYGDGSIMVETLAAGIAGTIRIPGASTPAADQALADQIIPGGGFSRGWPGAGRTAPGTTRRPGFRSRVGNMLAAPNWEFTDGTAPTNPVPAGPGTPAVPASRNDIATIYAGSSGDTIAATAANLDTALATVPDPAGGTRRIGLAAVGDDGALYVEGLTGTFDLVNGIETTAPDRARFAAAVPVDEPPRIGGTPERQLEPAAHLRRTHETRTLRIARDRNGHGVLAEHDDLGWVRNPADPELGTPESIAQMPPGRYLALSRADAAKTRNYDALSEMIVLSGTHADDPTRPVVLQARYWLDWDDSAEMGVVFGPDGLVMVRLEREIR